MLGSTFVAINGRKKFNLSELQKAVSKAGGGAIYDPSTLWGAADHLPRRNLLTYTEDPSNAAWTKSEVSVSANATTDPFGTSTAFSVKETTTSAGHTFYGAITCTVTDYKITLYLKGITKRYVLLFCSSTAFISATKYVTALIDLQSITATTALDSATQRAPKYVAVSDAGDSWVKVVLTVDAVAAGTGTFGFYIMNGPLWADRSYAGNVNNGVYVSSPMASIASTLDQSSQKITDWTTEQYAWAAAKNVPWLRRNMARSTDDLSTSAWTANGGTKTTTGILETATTGVHYVQQIVTPIAGANQIHARVVIKGVNRTWVCVLFGNDSNTGSSSTRRWVSLSDGSLGTLLTTATTDIAWSTNDLGSGYFEIKLSARFTNPIGGGGAYCNIYPMQADNGSFSYTGDASAGLLISGLQITTGSSPTDYQPIGASWDAQYAANAAAAGQTLTMYQDSAGTTAVSSPDQPIGKQNDLSGGGYHAVQSGATGLKPVLRLCPNGGWYLQRDLSDDNLVATFPNLGTACVTYVANGTTVTKATGVTINGATNLNTPAADYGRVILASESNKDAQIQKYLQAKNCV